MTVSTTIRLDAGVQLPPLQYRITRADLIRYSGASGDYNPVHWSDRVSREFGLPGVIAHGMLVMAFAGRAITEWVGDPRLLRMFDMRFSRPLFVPDAAAGAAIDVQGKVTERDAGRARLVLTVLDESGAVLGRAAAEIEVGETE